MVWKELKKKRVFCTKVEDRSGKTCIQVIKDNVIPGLIILTDMWPGYNSIDQYGFIHRTVNHSLNWVNPVDVTHTSTIEGTWNGIKHQVRPRNRIKNIQTNLFEYIWRKYYKADLWTAFLTALSFHS